MLTWKDHTVTHTTYMYITSVERASIQQHNYMFMLMTSMAYTAGVKRITGKARETAKVSKELLLAGIC